MLRHVKLGVVGSNLKMAKFALRQQHPTCRNRVAKRALHVTPSSVAKCCIGIVAIVWPGLNNLFIITDV